MEYFVPVYQFEIRYSKLLKFAFTAQDILAPFVPFANDIQVDQEYGTNAKYTLLYGNYQIIVQSDRLIFKFEGEINSLVESGSIVQDPFFSIYKRLTEQPSFGVAKNILLYVIYVKPIEKEDKNQITQGFKDKYIKIDEVSKIMNTVEDISLVLESKNGKEEVRLTFGPYFGILEVNKLGFIVFTQEMIDKCLTAGEMCSVAIQQNVMKDFNFSSYKTLHKLSGEYIQKLWD
jgi:hypothetical protein